MSNLFYLISSLFFLAAALLFVRSDASATNLINLAGAAFFVLAATAGLLRRETPTTHDARQTSAGDALRTIPGP